MAKQRDTESIKSQLERMPRKVLKEADFLHSGSTLLNMAITGYSNRGIAKGTYVLIVGDTSAGKTWLAHTLFAEASINSEFDKYELIYDNAENGALMDLEFFFGRKAAERIRAPRYENKDGIFSRTIEEFYYHVDDAIKAGKPFIYVLDSIDALTSAPEEKKFEEHKKASRSGSNPKGDYGDGKAKVSSRNIRHVVSDIERNGSILVILNQTRDNIDAGLFESKKTRSGGWALEFYAHLELWLSIAGHVVKTVKDRKRELGVTTRIRVKKNRFTGRIRNVEIPILHSFGIDDVGSWVDYLVDEKVWKKDTSGIVTVKGIGPEFTARRDKIVRRIEDEGLREDVIDLVSETWNGIEKACQVNRKNKYR